MKTPTIADLKKKHIPYGIAVGFIVAHLLGWDGKALNAIKDFHELRAFFPASGVVTIVKDGDTFVLKNGLEYRLIGINAPDVGDKNYDDSLAKLSGMILDKKVYLEYDRYQDDKFVRELAWVWINCEATPKFLPSDYMHKSNNESNPGLTQNPEGCKDGKLVNEEMVKSSLAQPTFYKDRGELKYQTRIKSIK